MRYIFSEVIFSWRRRRYAFEHFRFQGLGLLKFKKSVVIFLISVEIQRHFRVVLSQLISLVVKVSKIDKKNNNQKSKTSEDVRRRQSAKLKLLLFVLTFVVIVSTRCQKSTYSPYSPYNSQYLVIIVDIRSNNTLPVQTRHQSIGIIRVVGIYTHLHIHPHTYTHTYKKYDAIIHR